MPPGVSPSMSMLADHWGLVLTYGLITVGFGLVLAVVARRDPQGRSRVLIGIQLIITGVFRIIHGDRVQRPSRAAPGS